MDVTPSLWTFRRYRAEAPDSDGFECLVIHDGTGVRPCSDVEKRLYELLCQFVAATDLHEWGDAVTDARALIDFGTSE